MSKIGGPGGGHLGSGGQIRPNPINIAAATAASSPGAVVELPRIIYNGKNIDIPEDVSVMPWDPETIGVQNRSVSGLSETVIDRTDIRVSIAWNYLSENGASDLTRRRQLMQFAQWAQAGGAFFVARNRTKVVNTTLAADVSAGASTISVTSAAGIVEGDQYILRDEFYTMLCQVASGGISGPNITFEESIDRSFLAGARFRYAEFWPAVLAPGERVVKEHGPLHFDVAFDFIEDLNDL